MSTENVVPSLRTDVVRALSTFHIEWLTACVNQLQNDLRYKIFNQYFSTSTVIVGRTISEELVRRNLIVIDYN